MIIFMQQFQYINPYKMKGIASSKIVFTRHKLYLKW